MGWTDDIRGAAGVVGKAAGTAFRDGVGRVESWTEDRENGRRVDDFDDKMNKAASSAKAAGNDGTHEPSRDPKAISFDPFDLVSQMGWRERPSPMTYLTMEHISVTVPVVADVIRVRCTQVQTFCQRPEDRYSPGLKVRPRDKATKITKKVQDRCIELENNLLDCGFRFGREAHEITGLSEFAGMFVHDSLTFDQACFEIVPDRKGDPSYFQIVDPTTIRLIDAIDKKPDEPFAIQMLQNAIVADFTKHELAFCIRNPRSGIKTYGYGQGEIETLVREITGFLWGIDYNRRFFSNGSSTKGILNFKGTIPDRHLQAFRRQWYSMIQGVENAWRTPITNADDLQWINMQMSNKDMEFSSWIDFLIKIVCARYKIAPEVVNFSYGNSGQSQAMGTAPIEEKLKASKDLGLRPLVYWFFQQLNKNWIQRLDPDYEVVPVGFDAKGIDAETDLLQKQTKVYLTVDEAREVVGLKPLPDKKGDLILDPTWLQYFQSMEAEEEDGGEEGEDEYGDMGEGDESGGFADEEGEDGDAPPDNDFGFTDAETGEPLYDTGEGEAAPQAESEADDKSGDNKEPKVAKSLSPSIGLTGERLDSTLVRYELDL